ncbi:MAG: rhodanese-like domain-containing protein [Candidatus Uhrbacteria bacterium]|nr:rhodanese-like domain-containing protein [Candidatus Uhrbacteria bacterium]
MHNIEPQRLKEEMEKGTSMNIVDLQDSAGYQHAHIPGAINIPFDEFAKYFPGTLKDKGISIVLYGEYDELGKGTESGLMLETAGYKQIGRVVGGLRGWQEAGYPTEGGWES